MNFLILVLDFMLAAPITFALQFRSSSVIDNEARKAIKTSGDIVLGGLFPIHSPLRSNPEKHCSVLSHERGIHRVEAMMYAVDMINKNSSILKNYTIGVNVRDTCGMDTHALEESVHFIKGSGNSGGKCGSSDKQTVLFGVVGAASSGISMQVASLLRLFQILQISYASTSPDLSDRQKYENFYRTLPADTYQARAMIDVIRYFNWSSVFGIYSEDNYGTKGMEQFEDLTKTSGICMVASFKVNAGTDFSTIIEKMNDMESTRVVVLFLQTRDLSNLLKAVKLKITAAAASESQAKYRFKWVASDSWATRISIFRAEKLEGVANGAITLTPQSMIVKGFEDYFRNLRPKSNTRNPWFAKFWEEHHKCSLSNTSTHNMPLCNDNTTLLNNIKFDAKIPFVIDAVYSFAYAIKELITTMCSGGGGGCQLPKLKGKPLLDVFKRNFSFIGQLGRVEFDELGSTVRGYEINEFSAYPTVGYEKLGTWCHKLKDMKAKTSIKSFCSDICKIGQIKVLKKAGVTCCFKCRNCGANQFVEAETTCKLCNKSEMPNATRTGCKPLPEITIPTSWVIVMVILSGCGILTTVLVILIFLYHNETAVVKASGRELSYPLLVGIILCNTLPFFLLAEPTVATCGIIRFGFGVSFFICYAALVTKTIRIERIFKNATTTRSDKLALLKPSSQVLILIVAVLTEAVLALLGLFMEAPSTKINVDESKGQKYKLCVLPLYDTLVAFVSNIILIILCTVFAFRTRKVPACFNEAKYIGFVMYTTCVLWIAFVTIYFGLSFNYVGIALCMSIFLSATSILAGVFGPKVYIIIFRPGRNNRSRSNLATRHTYSHDTFSADFPAMQRKMTTLTEVHVDAMTQTEDCT